jgi:hypothetical protein
MGESSKESRVRPKICQQTKSYVTKKGFQYLKVEVIFVVVTGHPAGIGSALSPLHKHFCTGGISPDILPGKILVFSFVGPLILG